MSDDSNRVDGTRLDETDVRLLKALRTRAAPHFQRIAAEYLALLSSDGNKLVALEDVRARVELRRAMVAWIDRICSGTRPQALEVDLPALSAATSVSALFVIQEELGRLIDETMGPRASDARRALSRALAIEARIIVDSLERSGRSRMPSAPVDVRSPGERSAAQTLAHDIRNPLNGAMLHATFVERELEDLAAAPDVLEAVNTIKAEIRRVAELVDEFVDAPVPAPRPRARVPVSTLCSRAIELIARDAAAAGIEVGADISAELGTGDLTLEVDMSEMLEVLSQLLQQAVEAALSGGGKVLLRARREAQSAIIEVTHDQRALPAPILRSLLSGRTAQSSSSNVGNLNVALRVVADHGGTIEVDSQPGRTEFRVKLPIGAVQQRAADQS